MRGKDDGALPEPISNRITPAYAGKSITEIFQKDVNKDHPRLCGEKGKYENLYSQLKGSPPPMRGKGILRF